MANGLTSSDIQRQRLGFGVSPDTESRRRAVEAGVSPLTTEERIRQSWGWGPSEFAAPESRGAFQAAEVIERGGPLSEMPVEYGGRPTGTSRRALRMQAEYDAAQQEYLRNQLIEQQMEESAARMEDTRLEREAKELEKARQNKVRDEASMIFSAIRGGEEIVNPDGTTSITKPLNPNDEDALFRINNLLGLQYGLENQAAKQVLTRLQEDALRADEARRVKSQQDELAAINVSVRTQKPMSELGEYTETGIFKPKPSAIIAGEEQIKAEEAAKEEEKAIATETRRAKYELSKENRSEIKGIVEEINKIGSQIRENDSLLKTAKSTAERNELTRKAEFLRGEDANLRKRLDELATKPADQEQAQTTGQKTTARDIFGD